MWVLHERRHPMIDNKSVQEGKLRIMEVLFSDEIPDARDIVITSLADACGIFGGILSGRELAGAAQRIAQVSKMDLIGREISKAVRDIQLSLATAMAHMHRNASTWRRRVARHFLFPPNHTHIHLYEGSGKGDRATKTYERHQQGLGRRSRWM